MGLAHSTILNDFIGFTRSHLFRNITKQTAHIFPKEFDKLTVYFRNQ